MVAPTRRLNSGPRSPKRRLASERVTSAAARAFARRTPETTMERKNCSTVNPIPADAESIPGIADLICGPRRITASVRLVEAMLQRNPDDWPVLDTVGWRRDRQGSVFQPRDQRLNAFDQALAHQENRKN